jgi:hypothetical protein
MACVLPSRDLRFDRNEDALVNISGVRTAIATAAVSLAVFGCDGNPNPASPSRTPETHEPAPAPQTYNVAGSVRQSEPTVDGVPQVRVEVIGGPNAGQLTMTDADGRYALTALTAGTFRLRASREGYASAEQVVVLNGHTTVNFTIVRGSACALSGVVRESPGDAPSVGAVVAVVKEPGGYSAPAIVSTTTDPGGLYELAGIDCGVSRILRVSKPDFFDQQISVLFAGDTRKDLTLQRLTYTLRGIVRESASRTPLPDATVEVVSGPYAGRRAMSHVDGSYGLSVRDTVTVRVSKAGYESQDAIVTVAAPGADRDFSITSH